MASPRYQFRVLNETLNTDIARRMEDGIPEGIVLPRDLERYYEMLRRSLPKFSEEEARVLTAVVDPHKNSIRDISRLRADVEDFLQEHGIEGVTALVERLRSFSFAECVAIVDTIELYWKGAYYKDAEEVSRRLREVGLVKGKDHAEE